MLVLENEEFSITCGLSQTMVTAASYFLFLVFIAIILLLLGTNKHFAATKESCGTLQADLIFFFRNYFNF